MLSWVLAELLVDEYSDDSDTVSEDVKMNDESNNSLAIAKYQPSAPTPRCPSQTRRFARYRRYNLWTDLVLEDPNLFRRTLRMDTSCYAYLLDKVTPILSKATVQCMIPYDVRLSMTLRFLALGESQKSISLAYQVSTHTGRNAIKQGTSAVFEALKDHLRFPQTHEEWIAIADGYLSKWDYPHCLGTLNATCLRYTPPGFSCSNLVLMTVVDAKLCVVYAGVSIFGWKDLKQYWKNCSIKQKLDSGTWNLPAASVLNSGDNLPYVFVANSCIPLEHAVMVPYSDEKCKENSDRLIYNQRHAKVVQTAENAIGVMVTRFQILQCPIKVGIKFSGTLLLTCCMLHNLLRSDALGRTLYTPNGFVDTEMEDGSLQPGQWRSKFNKLTNEIPLYTKESNAETTSRKGEAIRDKFCEIFSTQLHAPWQN